MVKAVLDQLGEKYSKRIVSVIVGAGFSRNACKEYPLWKDLLCEMVEELYQEEIENAYLRFRKINPGTKMSLEVFTKEEVPRIIERVGYLKIVSEYIARKGYRESIEHYIEERIPYIDTTTKQFKYAGKNKHKVIDIDGNNFSAHKKLLEGDKWVRIYTTNYDCLLEYAVNANDKSYTVIRKARELSDNTDKTSIIKLHGDLYNPKEKRVFMFDGNPHQQYIISEEDYKNYPRDHEAFTQLMRISLLQGVFCLIGFSGDDPNFVNWISWVRDVLVTEDDEIKDKDEEKRTYKIFLIGLSKDEPDEVRKMFYENHNIVYVPLLRKDVKEVIGAEGIDEPRDLFCKFFDYLYNWKGAADAAQDTGDVPSRKAYNELWDKVYEVKHETNLPTSIKTIVTVDEEKLAQLYALKPWNRIVTYTFRQFNFLKEMVFKKEPLTEAEARLTLLAIEDTGLTVDDELVKKITASGIENEDVDKLKRQTERAETLLNSKYTEEQTENVDPYEQILRSLFTMDFKLAKELLDGWEPKGTDVTRKALVLSFFDKAQAKDILWNYIKQEPNEKEQFYATKLLNILEDTFPPVHPLDRYENANVQDYNKDLSNFIKRTLDIKEKIKGYGSGKNEKVFYIGGKPTKIREATAVLNFLLEAPAFVSYKNFYTLISSEKWYHIHKVIYERYPLPVLYYGLQCTDSKVKTRIGQDYAYSDYLAENYLEDILTYLLKACLVDATPDYLKESILIVARELFVSVKPQKWEDLFMQFWVEIVLKYRFEDVKSRLFDELDKFVEKALNSIATLSVRQRIIQDVLAHVKDDTGFAINCLYYLQSEPADLKGNEQLQAAVQKFVDEISTPDELNVAGNIYRLLTDDQKQTCAQKCMRLLSEEESKISNLVYHVSEFFVKGNPKMTAVFIKSICENPLLWKNGVIGEGSYSDFTYLKVSEFTRRVYIDKTSLMIIYERLKTSADEVVKFVERHHDDMPFYSDTEGLLREMITFLRQNEKGLFREEGYYEVLGRVSEAYRKVSGLGNVEDGLLSEYEEDVKKSLGYITANIKLFAPNEQERLFDIIINRVLLKNSDGLDTCIGYLWYYLNKRYVSTDNERLTDGLIRILDRYEKSDMQECNMDLVMTARYMGKMATILSGKGFKSKGIDYWKRFKRTSRFYSNFD